jgi:undecaprenyl-diphosphatase
MIEISESSLFHLINDLSGQNPLIDAFMVTFSHSNTWVLCALVSLVIAWRAKNPRLAAAIICALMALGVSDLISFEVVKPIVARERPCWTLPGVRNILGRCGGSYGFTSNHAANAFAVWFVVGSFYGFRSVVSLVVLWVATAVALSRVYLGVHYVGDIVGGAVLGIAIAAAMNALGLRRLGNLIAAKFIR